MCWSNNGDGLVRIAGEISAVKRLIILRIKNVAGAQFFHHHQLTRLLGVILAALSVQFVVDGIKSAFNLA
jgi:small neutral amino acid transporter SnatA (MarC family)